MSLFKKRRKRKIESNKKTKKYNISHSVMKKIREALKEIMEKHGVTKIKILDVKKRFRHTSRDYKRIPEKNIYYNKLFSSFIDLNEDELKTYDKLYNLYRILKILGYKPYVYKDKYGIEICFGLRSKYCYLVEVETNPFLNISLENSTLDCNDKECTYTFYPEASFDTKLTFYETSLGKLGILALDNVPSDCRIRYDRERQEYYYTCEEAYFPRAIVEDWLAEEYEGKVKLSIDKVIEKLLVVAFLGEK